jgi:hypothetical protein
MGAAHSCPRCLQPLSRWGCHPLVESALPGVGPGWECQAPTDPPPPAPKPPDVPTSSLTPRKRLHPDAARLRHSRPLPFDPRGACQVCESAVRPGAHLVVVEPVVDPNNGQRITVALCWDCVIHLVALHNSPAPVASPGRRRRRAAEKA